MYDSLHSQTSEEAAESEDPDLDAPTFINHESYFDCEPSTSKTPLLERMRKGYG